jgi:hypothetical protein
MSTTPRVSIEHPPAGTLAERSAAGDPPATTSGPSRPTLEEIAQEAYAIYMANGAQDGHDLDDWLEAERRIVARQKDGQQATTERQQDERYVRQGTATSKRARVDDSAPV